MLHVDSSCALMFLAVLHVLRLMQRADVDVCFLCFLTCVNDFDDFHMVFKSFVIFAQVAAS